MLNLFLSVVFCLVSNYVLVLIPIKLKPYAVGFAMGNSWLRQSKAFHKSVNKAPNILLLWTDLSHFPNIARMHCWVLKPFQNPHWYFEIFSKNCDICSNIHFSNIFDKFRKMLTGLVSFDIFLPFLYKEVISACLRISGNIDNFIELLKILQIKLPKKSLVSFKTFIGISELCDTVFTSSFKISFSICFASPSIKLKLHLSLHLLWMATMLGWYVFKDVSLVLLTKGSSFEYLEIWRFCTMLEKCF